MPVVPGLEPGGDLCPPSSTLLSTNTSYSSQGLSEAMNVEPFDFKVPLVQDVSIQVAAVLGGAIRVRPLQAIPLLTSFLQSEQDDSSHPTVNEQPIEDNHWKGLLWQSFGFFAVENSFRLATDHYFRYLTADKPFWHDYIASLKQWNMRRWSDGDDFLVAYVGHPIQGTVSEFIEIQNDPQGRSLQISSDSAYWKSRFKSFLWATAFSTDQKVGPLGETAFGSEGGYTYVIGCAGPCPTYNPATYKVTNNTGWVKFITKPVIGTLWTLAEDFLDRYVSDRVQGDNLDAVFPKILRGSINPSRTMANFLRGKNPWYRDYQHPEDHLASGVNFERDDEEIIRNLPRYEFFPHIDGLSLPVNISSSCQPCRQFSTGAGIGFFYSLSRWWDVESDVAHHADVSTLPSERAGGDLLVGTFGLGLGLRTPNYLLKFSVRPGFASYDRAYFTVPVASDPVPEIGRITHFATTLAMTGDYGFTGTWQSASWQRTPQSAMRPIASIAHLALARLPISSGSRQIYATNGNWAYQTGPVLPF